MYGTVTPSLMFDGLYTKEADLVVVPVQDQ